MSYRVYKSFTCECGERHTYPSYVFSYWVNESERRCSCGKIYRILIDCDSVLVCG